MSDVVDNILGIDMVDSAIADAIFNADLNGNLPKIKVFVYECMKLIKSFF